MIQSNNQFRELVLSDLLFYYDLIRFLHERLSSQASASTYVYYYTNPPIFHFKNLLRRMPEMVGHFAELDLIWGIPFFNNNSRKNLLYQMNISYTSKETQLSYEMIRYWTNFAKTGTQRLTNEKSFFSPRFLGNPNDEKNLSVYWPLYAENSKSYINFHADHIRTETNFLEEHFQFWDSILHRQICTPFRWYHTCLLVGILILTILLVLIYIFYNNKRARRNIIPTDLTNGHIITTYHFLPSVVT